MTLPELDAVLQTAIDRHGADSDALIPILLEINRAYGYIPPEMLRSVRKRLHQPAEGTFVQESQLNALSSFYHMFSRKPLGEHVIILCESAPCHVEGGRALRAALEARLGIQVGETSPDGKWSLLSTSCLGVCGVGPVFILDGQVYGGITVEKLDHILAACGGSQEE